MSEPAEPKAPAPKLPRVLREPGPESFVYSVTPGQKPEVWLFGAQRNVIPPGDDEGTRLQTDERTIELGTGSVTITITTDLFELGDVDRAFVFQLVDLVKAYEAGE